MTNRIPGLSEFTSQACALIRRKRIDGCSFVSLAMKLNQTTIKSFLFKWMQWCRLCGLLWISLCIWVYCVSSCVCVCMCACISYAHLNVLKCVGQGKCCTRAHADTHTNKIQKMVRAFKWGYGWVCAVYGCNQLLSIGAACSNQRHKCQLLSPAHASICIH